MYFYFFSGFSHSNPLSLFKTPFLFILCPLPIPFSLLSVPPKLPYAVLVSLRIISHHIVSSFCSTVIASSQFPKLDPGAQHLTWECPGRGPSWTQSGERGVGRDSIPSSAQCCLNASSPWACRKGPWRELFCVSYKCCLGLGISVPCAVNADPDAVPNIRS